MYFCSYLEGGKVWVTFQSKSDDKVDLMVQHSAEQLNAEPSAECNPIPNFKKFREGGARTGYDWWSTFSIDSVCLEPDSVEISQVG